MLKSAVCLSVILGFVAQEFLGLASGGLISAGYLAFYLNQPLRIVSTLVMAILIWLTMLALDKVIFIYGRRRFACCVILGIIYAWIFNELLFLTSFISQDLRIIGYVVPGLVANDMVKQGVFKTISMLLIISFIIALLHYAGVF